MNNKNVKYFLIVAVIAVWATIIYRVTGGLGPGTSSPPPPVPSSRNHLKMASDTFTLYADYPDPFLPEADTASGDTIVARKPTPPLSAGNASPASAEEFPGRIIQLTGIIGNPQKKSRVAIIILRGKEYLVREKEKIENIYIKRIEKDRIRILYKGEPFTIEK